MKNLSFLKNAVVSVFILFSFSAYGAISVQEIENPIISESRLDITEDIIAYDGNPSVFLNNLTEPGTLFDVRFTPLEACSLAAVEVVSSPGTAEGIIHVYADSEGVPSAEMMTPVTVTLWGNLLRQRINLNIPIDIDSADFHIALEYAQAPPPYVALDNNGGTGRSSFREPGGDWTIISAHDLNIRAYVNYYISDIDPPVIECLPRVLGFSVEPSYTISAEITDLSGVMSASVFYSVDSHDFTEIAMSNISGNTWNADIPQYPAGSSIYYYISASDSSQNHNSAVFPDGGPDNPFVLQIVDGYEISYEGGFPEAYWIVGSAWDNNRFGVRITPEEYPFKITGARVMVDAGTQFDLTINNDNSGMPGSVITGPFEMARNAEDWAILFIPEIQQPEIAEGDFWIILHWRMESPSSPGVGVDMSSPDLRSRRYTDTSGWIPVNTADFIMRAFGVSITSGINNTADLPEPSRNFNILGNYPNPFNSRTNIRFEIYNAGKMTINIYDLAGRKVTTLFSGNIDPGLHSIEWNGKDISGSQVSSGIYFFGLVLDGKSQLKKMLLLK